MFRTLSKANEYSNDFKNAVRKIFGNDYDSLLQQRSERLGRYLSDASLGTISVDEILRATNLDDLKKKAQLLKDVKNLYSMWDSEWYID